MTDAEIQAEIERQLHQKLSRLAAKLRATAQEHGPVIGKALKLIADDMDQFD
jgi:hypothetical protein